MTDAWADAWADTHAGEKPVWGDPSVWHRTAACATRIAETLALPSLDGVEVYAALRDGMIAYIEARQRSHEAGFGGGPSLLDYSHDPGRWQRARSESGIFTGLDYSNEGRAE